MIIAGIDPGIATTGFGIIEHKSGKLTYITAGAILTDKATPMPLRLQEVYEQVRALFNEYAPDCLATEQIFFGNNVTTALQVGRSVGVVLLAAAQKNIAWTEYRPVEVKSAVVGYGAADKKQVQFMVKQLLSLEKIPKPDDAADALAIAICHAHSAHLVNLTR